MAEPVTHRHRVTGHNLGFRGCLTQSNRASCGQFGEMSLSKVTRELLLYTLAMGIALAADVATLAALVELAAVPYLAAATVAFVVGGLIAYLLCVQLIFAYRRIDDRRVEAATFIGLGLVGLVVNLGGIWVGVEFLMVHYLIAKIVAAGLSFVTNYGLRRFILFTAFAREEPGQG